MNCFHCFLLLLFLLLFVGTAEAGDEQQINEDLKNGNVLLEARTYTITDSIVLQSDRVLEGQPGTIITIPDHAGWETFKPLIKGTGCKNVIIKNIEFDGNDLNNYDVASKTHNGKAWGNGFYNFIHVIDCDSVEVSGCFMHDSLGDGLRTKTSTNIIFRDNTAYRLGHDVLFVLDSKNIEAYNNRITTRINGALRAWNCQGVRFHDNQIDSQLDSLGGGHGIQIEFSKFFEDPDTEVCNNIVKKTWWTGCWLIAYDDGVRITKGVSIHHNLFTESGPSYNIPSTAGITFSGLNGADIHNNVFDGAYNSAFLIISGDDITIRDCIITNTQEHSAINQAGTGYGVANRASAGMTIKDNCFWGNVNGNLYKCTSSGDDTEDPKKHLTSSGWTWTGKTWTCEFVAPSELGEVEPTKTKDTVDNDISEFDSIFDVLDMEFSDSGYIEQAGITAINPEWETKGKYTEAYIYLAGYNGQINYDGVLYIPEKPSKCAIILTDTRNLADKPNGQTSSVKLTDGKDGSLKVTLKVKTKYKVKDYKTVTVLGKSVKIPYYKEKSETVTFTRVYQDVPDRFPILSAEDVNVTVNYYNSSYNPHATVTVDGDITGATYRYNGSEAREYRLIGYVGQSPNGLKTANFKKTYTWKFSDPDLMSYSYQALYIKGPFDLDRLQVTVLTPYSEIPIENYNFIEYGDPTEEKLNPAPFVIIIVLLIILRPLLQELSYNFCRFR